jgi:hypothetical protein
MMTRATPVAPALPAVDDSAANPLRPGTKPECLLRAGGPAAGAKLWSVYPKLYRWPPVSGVAHAIKRAAILSLLGGALLHPGHRYAVRLIARQPGRYADQVAAGGDGAVSEQPLAGRWWWAGLAVGGAIGLLLTHDRLVEPVVHLAGCWVRRAPGAWRWPLQVGLVVSGVLALARVPVLYGVGQATQLGNDSILPGDYPRALAGVLALVWTGVLAPSSVRHLRARGWTARARAP